MSLNKNCGKKYEPRLIAWEITRRCHLKCLHCRASALDKQYSEELSTREIKRTLESIASFSKPIIILTGGEPMLREDLYEIASYGNSLGLRMVMAPCGKLVTADSIKKMKESGIVRISLSIDGSCAKSHDDFRGLKGSFDDAINAAKIAHENGMPFQVNTTVTKSNAHEIRDILKLAVSLGAVSYHPFLLVPTGRGRDLLGQEPSAKEYEKILSEIEAMSREFDIHIKPTCAPHYFRILRQVSSSPPLRERIAIPSPFMGEGQGEGEKRELEMRSKAHDMDSAIGGCLGGTAFAFISHTGVVQICGFLDVDCGNIRESNYDFKKIWDTSDVFKKMRDVNAYLGKCGKCEFHKFCRGCRARAYALTGDYMNPEPYCEYEPKGKALSVLDRKILTRLQDSFPITHDPFSEIAEEFQISREEMLAKINKWKEMKLLRRLSATIDTNALGFKGALVAMKVDGNKIDEVTKIIAKHPGVSHCYLRDHDYNVWFTIKVPPEFDLDVHVQKISLSCGAKHHLILPSVKNYKLNVRFDFVEMKGAHLEKGPKRATAVIAIPPQAGEAIQQKPLKPLDRHVGFQPPRDDVIKELNSGLELVAHPFEKMASKLGLDEKTVIDSVRAMRESGIIEKIKFAMNHISLGITSNSMVVWDFEEKRKDEAGKIFAAKDFISHCYERTRYKEFPYSIYTMIHSSSEKHLNELIDELKKEVSPLAFCRLDTKKEMIKRKAEVAREEYERF